jgi:hypothetical protein
MNELAKGLVIIDYELLNIAADLEKSVPLNCYNNSIISIKQMINSTMRMI